MSKIEITPIIKAIRNAMNSAKKGSSVNFMEYEIAFQSSNERGHVYNQSELNTMFFRTDDDEAEWSGIDDLVSFGATKSVWLGYYDSSTGEHIQFNNIVVKRIKQDPYMPLGNQLHDEVEMWCKYQNTVDSDYLCPILKKHESKSDKVEPNSEKAMNNIVVIAQKAVYVSNCFNACRKAAIMNSMFKQYDYDDLPESLQQIIDAEATRRYREMRKFADNNGWWDVMNNRGNTGVIYDYCKKCYKAVFIDYAL